MKRSILLNALACSALLLGGCSGKGAADSTKSSAKSGDLVAEMRFVGRGEQRHGAGPAPTCETRAQVRQRG